MPLPRFEKLDPARQEAILAAARAEFARLGFEEASLNRIIAGAGGYFLILYTLGFRMNALLPEREPE